MSQPRTYASPDFTASPVDQTPAGSCGFDQNEAGTDIQQWHKSDTSCSGDVHAPAKENPGALAGATGTMEEASKLRRKVYADAGASASKGMPLPGSWNRVRWAWKRAVRRDARLSKTAKLLAVTLVDDFANNDSGRCNPTVSTLCEATGDPERTVQKALTDLQACGWIHRKKGRGRGRSSETTFTAEPEAAAQIGCARDNAPAGRSEKPVQNSAPYRAKTVARQQTQKVQLAAPIDVKEAVKKVQEPAQKGAAAGGSYKEPRYNLKTQGSGFCEKPICNLASVAHFGSDREAAWNEYLAARGWPSLAQLGVLSSDREGRGWEVPYRRPPGRNNHLENRITVRWVEWAMHKMEEREAA
ncbi:helix-turn-helix domain-containing protein [Paracoccus sp. S4493]|uniref:helix-turn-helix domain-containing protein n=1 Tax=Paracoccus sp. S4493 TaxID=579490 RepID=UPI000A61678F|nr:helix-turn-helix domain-containing protein [Paracoccus sp. S4493]